MAKRFLDFAKWPLSFRVNIPEPIQEDVELTVHVSRHYWPGVTYEDAMMDSWPGFDEPLSLQSICLIRDRLSSETVPMLSACVSWVKKVLQEDTETAVAFLTQLALAHLDYCRHLDGQEFLLQGVLWRDLPPEPPSRIDRIQRMRDRPPMPVSALFIWARVINPLYCDEKLLDAEDVVPLQSLDYRVLPPIEAQGYDRLVGRSEPNTGWSLRDNAVRLLAIHFMRLFDSTDETGRNVDWSNYYRDRREAGDVLSRLVHSPDYRSVRLDGVTYELTTMQAQVVEFLTTQLENKTPAVSEQYILEGLLETKQTRLKDIFRNSDAWGKLIVRGKARGTFQINL